MIWFFGAAALSFVLTAAFGILPDSSFLPLPDAVYTSFALIGSWTGWCLSLLGDSIKEAVIVCGQVLVGVYLTFFLFDILRFFNVPVIDRFLGWMGSNQK